MNPELSDMEICKCALFHLHDATRQLEKGKDVLGVIEKKEKDKWPRDNICQRPKQEYKWKAKERKVHSSWGDEETSPSGGNFKVGLWKINLKMNEEIPKRKWISKVLKHRRD